MSNVWYGAPQQPKEEPRRFICQMPCPNCGGPAKLYGGDLRSRGWRRVECLAGHWGDLGPDSILIPEAYRVR